MNDIRALLKLAARRLEWTSFLNRAHAVAVILAGLALVLMVAGRLPAEDFVPWVWVIPVLAGLGLAIALLLWSRRRRSEMDVAVEVDDRLQLREKLSTALHCQGRTDPFALAAVADAVATAGDARNRELLRRRFKIESPRGWWLSPMIIFAAFMISYIDPQNLFASDEVKIDQAAMVQTKEADVRIEAMVNQFNEKNPNADEKIKQMLGELTEANEVDKEFKTPEDAKRNRIKKLTDLQKKLDDLLSGEEGKTAEAIREALKGIKPGDKDSDAAELADALSRGDFKAAQNALKQLMEKAKSGNLTDEQKKQLADQLQNIADQLNKLAQQQKKLEEALKQAGLDPQLAGNPQALQQALKNANLNQQQRQQLQQMAKAQQAACKMCQGMGGAMQQMAQGMKGGQQGQMGQAGQQMGQMLNNMEMMQQMMQQAQALANQAQSQCQGLGQGLGQKQGKGGMGGRGQGRGGNAPVSPTRYRTKTVKANIKNRSGDIIARMLIDSKEQYKGEATKSLAHVVIEELPDVVEDSVEDEPVPQKYRDAQKHYFGEVEKRTREIIDGEDTGDDGGDAEETPEENDS